jgi:DNA ligase 1
MYQRTLFKKDSKDKIRSWTIAVQDNGDNADVVINSGLLDGKMVEQKYTITEGKNIGKANETTYLQQAVSEAESRVANQIKDGYVLSIEDLRESGIKGSGVPSVMLARAYDPNKKQSGSKDLAGYKLEGKRVGIQRKYDGVRRLALINETGVKMYTRSGDLSDTLPHIEAQLFEMYKRHGFVGNVYVDGEAYSDELTFNEINGITRKGIKDAKDAALRNKIQYHVYDYISDSDYETRHGMLRRFAHTHVIPVETIIINANAELLRTYHDQFVLEGYEGLMIRVLDAGYVNKRSNTLLKYKDFDDDNFVVVDVLPTTDGSRAGKFVVKMDRHAVDANGKVIDTFNPVPVGPHSLLKEFLDNKQDVIGRTVKVNFFGRSEYGVPRFPRVKGFVLNQIWTHLKE